MSNVEFLALATKFLTLYKQIMYSEADQSIVTKIEFDQFQLKVTIHDYYGGKDDILLFSNEQEMDDYFDQVKAIAADA